MSFVVCTDTSAYKGKGVLILLGLSQKDGDSLSYERSCSSLDRTAFRSMLHRFDSAGWKGRNRSGDWEIANGGYDLWFEVYYRGIPVIQCIAGQVSRITVSGDPDMAAAVTAAVDVILAEFPHLKLKAV